MAICRFCLGEGKCWEKCPTQLPAGPERDLAIVGNATIRELAALMTVVSRFKGVELGKSEDCAWREGAELKKELQPFCPSCLEKLRKFFREDDVELNPADVSGEIIFLPNQIDVITVSRAFGHIFGRDREK